MSARDKFQQIKNYAVYYANGELTELSEFDAVIVEPKCHDRHSLQVLQGNQTLVLGYVSVMELGPNDDEWHRLNESDFLHRDGQRIPKPEYGNFLLDLTSAHWRGLLHYRIGQLLTAYRYDGIFFDTIGNAEAHGLPNGTAQVQAAVDFVSQVRKWFPNSILVQNNGLELLLPRVAHHLDGVVWENPPIDKKASEDWVRLISERLENVAKSHSVKVMALFESVDSMNRQDWIIRRSFADSRGFLSYFSPRHYVGEPGKKFQV